MKRKHQSKTEEQTAPARSKNRVAMKSKWQFKTEEQSATARPKSRVAMKRKHQSNTEEQTALARSKIRVAMKRKHQSDTEERIAARRCQAVTEENNDGMTYVINRSMNGAKKILHRTQDTADTPHKQRAIECIICNCFIIGTETIHKLKKEEIFAHRKRLSVESYKSTMTQP
jgi:hypothetical protein